MQGGVPLAAKRELAEELRLSIVRDRCASEPKAFINEIRFYDPSQADDEEPAWVEFKMFPPEGWEAPVIWLPGGDFEFVKTGASDWYWQSLLIDWLHNPKIKKYLILKARQLGITLLACAYALWLMLFRPGSACVAYSYNEDEAKKIVSAVWAMFKALPPILKQHVEVLSPRHSEVPSEWIKLQHSDDRISSFQALPATEKAGHGARVTFAIMDEVAYQTYAKRIYTAINPATTRGRAKLLMISTAYGTANEETGEGNYFSRLYQTKEEKKLAFKFLPWNLEPTRDQKWYDTEAMKLDDAERNQQYPLTENDAFILSGTVFFDRNALEFYRREAVRPEFTGQFVVTGRRRATFQILPDGIIEVYQRPRPDHSYAIGIDCARGTGSDYTSGDVIDLSSGAIVAHLRAKIEAPRAAVQFHYLGKWFAGKDEMALVCIERQGGYGDALIIAMRDGNDNLPPYSRLYRHKKYTSGRKPMAEEFGIPMASNRPSLLDQLKSWIRERRFPWLGRGHVHELGTFVYAATNPSPRAQDGANDDRVISLALAVEMFRQYGQHPAKKRRWKRRKYQPHPTRQI